MTECMFVISSKDFAARAHVDLSHQKQYIESLTSLPRQVVPQSNREERDLRQNIPLISGSVHPTNISNLGNFLRYHHELVISTTIQECTVLSAREFRKKYNDSMHREWNSTKMDILNHLGCNQEHFGTDDAIQPALSLLNSSQLHNRSNLLPVRQSDDHMMEDTEVEAQLEESFAKIVSDISRSRTLSTPMVDFDGDAGNQQHSRNNIFAPIAQFAVTQRAICDQFRNRRHGGGTLAVPLLEEFGDLWRFLSSMLFETGMVHDERQCYLREHEYRTQYQNGHLGLQRLLAKGARSYLERQYFDLIEKAVDKNKNFAKRGGKPGKQYMIKAFIRLCYKNGSTIPNEYRSIQIENERFPLWPLIYHSYRSGDIESGIYFAKFDPAASVIAECLINLRQKTFEFQQNAANQDIGTVIRLFDQNPVTLDEAVWRKLDSHFKEHVLRKSRDPFEVAIYVIIGRLFVDELFDSETVMGRMEDFLWFKLATMYFEEREKPEWIDSTLASSSQNGNAFFPSISMSHFQRTIVCRTPLI